MTLSRTYLAQMDALKKHRAKAHRTGARGTHNAEQTGYCGRCAARG